MPITDRLLIGLTNGEMGGLIAIPASGRAGAPDDPMLDKLGEGRGRRAGAAGDGEADAVSEFIV